MNIKITGKIEKPVEINPLDVIRELKLEFVKALNVLTNKLS